MPDPVLVVPVEVEALVVNDAILRRDSFRSWQYNYKALQQYRSPEPEAGDRDVGGHPRGVHLGWSLPRALRHGTRDPKSGDIAYPLVPNRWLVLRVSGDQPRHATGWVVESDCPHTARVQQLGVGVERTSMYPPGPDTIRAWRAGPDPYRSGVTLDPDATEPQVANIGVPFPLAQGWTERAASPMFLTAVAPGNPAFAAYAPHNLGVFTFIDDLKDLPSQLPQSLSYLVVGWYSDPAGDILAGWKHDTPSAQNPDPYQGLLDRLGWSVAPPLSGAGAGTARAARSLYRGSVLSVAWDPTRAPDRDPLPPLRTSGQVQVALGNTAEDAFLALVGRRLVAAGHPAATVEQLKAFLYGLLPLANQPNGDALVRRAIAARRFGAHDGGQHWTVAAADPAGTGAPPRPGPAVPAPPDPPPPVWLDRLNADQRRLDVEVAGLKRAQWDVNALWWKRGRYPTDSFPVPPPGVPSIDPLTAQLDPGRPGSAAARLLDLLHQVLIDAGNVPQPLDAGAATPQQALQNGIAEFARRRGLPPEQTLKALPAEPYWQAGDPVVMISGVDASAEADAAGTLPVRLLSEVPTAFRAGGLTIGLVAARSVLPLSLPGFSGPADVSDALVEALLAEFVLTDPGSAAALAAFTRLPAQTLAATISAHRAADYLGVLPATGLAPWAQPWRPLFAEWQVRYIDVPQKPGSPAWRFDGTDYACVPGAAAGRTRTIGGISLIGPHAPQVFRERLAEFVHQYGSADEVAQLDAWISEAAGWRFLSQELTGFSRLLAGRDRRAFRRPRPEERIGARPLLDALGYPGAGTPSGQQGLPGPAGPLPDRYRGAVTSVPYLPAGADVPFFGVRQGQIIFQELVLYDRFGRTLPVILPGSSSGLYSAENFPLVVDPALAPTTVLDARAAAPAQLPPRLAQPARLDFALLDVGTGADSTLSSAADPVGGWVLPNHLDRALLLYAPDGTALGELRVTVGVNGARSVSWSAPVHGTAGAGAGGSASAVTSAAAVTRLAPLVGALLGSPVLSSAAGFDAFLAAIDATLWTTDPLGNRADQNLSVLIGRPLALVRARVRLELDGPPITDSGWAATLAPPVPEFLGQEFAVRLGDQATRDDGLIGYFTAGDLAVFNTVSDPASNTASETGAVPGIQPIGAVRADGRSNYLWRRCVAPSPAPDAVTPVDRADPHEEIVMLLDPRGTVHATTGILPTRAVGLRPERVSAALAKLEVSFQVGAALTAIRPTSVPAGQVPQFPESVDFPRPAEDQGTWSWWQAAEPSGGAGADAWTGYGVADPGTDAALRPGTAVLLDGVLQLIVDAGADSGPATHP